jgi:hypothetical protein
MDEQISRWLSDHWPQLAFAAFLAVPMLRFIMGGTPTRKAGQGPHRTHPARQDGPIIRPPLPGAPTLRDDDEPGADHDEPGNSITRPWR